MAGYAPIGSYWDGEMLVHVYPMKRTRKKIQWTRAEQPQFMTNSGVKVRKKRK